jgi:predicted DNA-binding ribbon-helix-helix protein
MTIKVRIYILKSLFYLENEKSMLFDLIYTNYGIIISKPDNLDIISMGSLIIRNFRHGNKRSSLKLEHELWLALHHVAKDLNQSEKNILTALAEYKDKNISDHGDGTFTSLVRVFIVNSIIKKSNGSVDYTKQRDGNLNGLLSRVLSHSPT